MENQALEDKKDSKVELINELAFLLEIREKVWRYHPNNPKPKSAIEEYDQVQIEISQIEKLLEEID